MTHRRCPLYLCSLPGHDKRVGVRDCPMLVKRNSGVLDNLVPSTTYHVRVTSTDIAGNAGASSDRIFTSGASSLALNGATGYAEAPSTSDLNVAADWTVELWFKDDDAR